MQQASSYYSTADHYLFISILGEIQLSCDEVVFVLLIVQRLLKRTIRLHNVFLWRNPGSCTGRHKPNPPGDASGSRRRELASESAMYMYLQ